jgi:hypothetical protein
MDKSGKPDPTKDTVTPDGVYTRFTLGLTAAYLVIVAVAFFGGHIGKSAEMNPNEWGDLAAGVFAPLAWLWLAVGYYLQRLELIEQRNEIRLARLAAEAQASEQRNQALAMQNLVVVTTKQSEVAARQLEMQEKIARVGTRPRFFPSCTEVSTGKLAISIQNSGCTATEVKITVTGQWHITYRSWLGELADIESESCVDIELEPNDDYAGGDARLHIRLSLSDVMDVVHVFGIRSNGVCNSVNRQLVPLS